MEAIFSLPYSEYSVIVQLQKKMKKSEGFSFYIPTSRQQKGIDFIIHHNDNNKLLRIQVKSSRTYIDYSNKLKSNKIKYKYHLWFNNFIDKFKNNNADYYFLFGLFPVYNQDKNIKSKNKFWKSLILCFDEKEMYELLNNLKTKKEHKPEKFFNFSFNSEDQVFATRGFDNNLDISHFLLDNKLEKIKLKFN